MTVKSRGHLCDEQTVIPCLMSATASVGNFPITITLTFMMTHPHHGHMSGLCTYTQVIKFSHCGRILNLDVHYTMGAALCFKFYSITKVSQSLMSDIS